jgi:hypothetical protein
LFDGIIAVAIENVEVTDAILGKKRSRHTTMESDIKGY